jgi:hypothetical protein
MLEMREARDASLASTDFYRVSLTYVVLSLALEW